MIRFEKLEVPEKIYPYTDVTVAADYPNGIMGTVTNGVFTKGAGTVFIDQVEWGDDAYSEKFVIPKDAHARTADIADERLAGKTVNITADELPATYAVDNVLVADTTGLLKVGTGAGFKVIEKTKYGVRAVIVGA